MASVFKVNKAGNAGAMTQSGYKARTVISDGTIEAGMPVKVVDDKAAVLEASDTMAAFRGIVIRDPAPYGVRHEDPDFIGVLYDGFIQVPVDETVTIVAGDKVYFDAENKVFTNASGVEIPAVFEVDGSADGVAEIHVIPTVPAASASSADSSDESAETVTE